MKRILALMLLVCGLLAFACAYGQSGPSAPTNNAPKAERSSSDQKPDALLVFYRPKRFTGGGLTPSVYLDGKELARLDNGRFFSIPVASGKHQVSSSMKHPPLEIEVKSGEATYLEMVILTGTWRGGGRFVPAPIDDALAAIGKLKALDAKWVTEPSVGFDTKLPAASADKNANPAQNVSN